MIAEIATELAVADAPTVDPWDAPYFGGKVYFSYQPTQLPTPTASLHNMAATSSAHATNAWEPWDAPYFGAPIYLRFPEFAAGHVMPNVQMGVASPEPTPARQAIGMVSGSADRAYLAAEPDTDAAVANVPSAALRNWLGRLFGGWRR